MKKSVTKIHKALEILELPVLISLTDLKKHYRYLARQYHPDIVGNEEKMGLINESYTLLSEYMKNYKFSFSEEEILKQHPEESHASRFKF